MVEKKERKSYKDVELNTQKTTLAKSIESEKKLNSIRANLVIDAIGCSSRKRTYREERSFEEPQGPHMG